MQPSQVCAEFVSMVTQCYVLYDSTYTASAPGQMGVCVCAKEGERERERDGWDLQFALFPSAVTLFGWAAE